MGWRLLSAAARNQTFHALRWRMAWQHNASFRESGWIKFLDRRPRTSPCRGSSFSIRLCIVSLLSYSKFTQQSHSLLLVAWICRRTVENKQRYKIANFHTCRMKRRQQERTMKGGRILQKISWEFMGEPFLIIIAAPIDKHDNMNLWSPAFDQLIVMMAEAYLWHSWLTQWRCCTRAE